MRLGAYINPGGDLTAAVTLARLAEQLDYESVWVTHGLGRDSFLVLAAYGAVTSRIGLGNGVVPIYPRHPVAMAQAALSLSEMTGGRFRLGIGVSHRSSIEAMLGLTVLDPLAVMREYVAVLRGALGAGAAFEGKYYRVHWSLALPTRPAAPPIYLAALGPKMCELAGEIADGAMLWLCNPNYIRDVVVPEVTAGREAAGKSLDGFDIVAAVPSGIAEDREKAFGAMRQELLTYFSLPFYRTMIERSGYDGDIKAFDEAMAGGDADKAKAAISDDFLEALTAIGSEDQVRAGIERYRDAGSTSPCIGGIPGSDFEATLGAAAELL